jgi:cysteinyl-tRNA synthetase
VENIEHPTTNIEHRSDAFAEALDDDLNISAALGFLFETIRETNRALDQGSLTAAEARGWLEWWKRIDTVLALSAEESGLPAEVAALAEQRAQARLAKDWRKSDELRDQLAALGWEARDTKDGQKVTRRAGA